MVLTLLENISVILISLLCFILGIIVYLKNPKSASHRLFILFCADTVLWTITNYISLHYLNLFLDAIGNVFCRTSSISLFSLCPYFPKRKNSTLQKNYLDFSRFYSFSNGINPLPSSIYSIRI